MKTVIELLVWGDFDIKTTDCIMISQFEFDIEDIKNDFCRINNISSFSGLPSNLLSDYNEKFKKFLISLGFKELKTTPIYFCD